MRVMSRRQAIKLGAAGVGGSLVVAACGDSDTAAAPAATTAAPGTTVAATVAPADAEPFDILFDMDYGGTPGSMSQYWRALIERFNAAGMGVEVGDAREVGIGDLFTAITAAHTAGEGADIETYFANSPTFGFLSQGVLHPMDDFVGGREEIDHWKFTGAEFGGKQYHSPFFAEIGMMAVNKKILAAAGVDVPLRWESWEALMAAAQAVKANGDTPILVGAADGFNAEKWEMAAQMEYMNSPFDLTRWVVGQASADEVYVTSWIDRMGQLVTDEIINDDAGIVTEQEAIDRFVAGEGAMMMLYPAVLFNQDPEIFDVVGYWKGPGAISAGITTAGTGMVLTNIGRNPEGAGEFIKFLHQPDQLKLFNETTSELPCDDRFDPSGLAPLPAKTWEILNQDPEPIWIHDFAGPGIIGPIMYTLGSKLFLEGPEGIKEQYIREIEDWRERNPENVETVTAFIEAGGG